MRHVFNAFLSEPDDMSAQRGFGRPWSRSPSPRVSPRSGARALPSRAVALGVTTLWLAGCSYPNSEFARTSFPQPIPTTQLASLPTPAVASAPPRANSESPTPHAAKRAAQPFFADEQPLVVIRFAQPDVDYEQSLYTAVNEALKRKPSATFTIQAVSPGADSTADAKAKIAASEQDAEKVFHSLRDMGMPPDRLALAATTIPDLEAREIRVYVH